MFYTFHIFNTPTMDSLVYFKAVKKEKKLTVLVSTFKWHRFSHASLGYSFIARWKKKFWIIKSLQSNRGLSLFHKSKFIKGAKYRAKLEQKRILKEKKEAEKAAQKKQKKKPWQGPIKVAKKEITSAFEDEIVRSAFERSLVKQVKKVEIGKNWGFCRCSSDM